MSHRARDADARGGLRLARPPWRPRAAAGLLVVAVALVAAWWAVDALWLAEPPAADVAVHQAVLDARTPAVVTVAIAVTRLGDFWGVAAAGAVAALLAWRRTGRWDPGVLAATVVLGVLAVTSAVKALTARSRPEEAVIDLLTLAFPSGHASRAAAVCVLVGWLAWRLARSAAVRLSVAVLAVVMAAAIGASRVVLGVHWPTDVLAGWLLGGLWAYATLTITRPRAPDR